MIEKIAKILTWMGIVAWFAVIMGFVSAESEGVICNRIDVILKDTVNNRFVTRGDIREMLSAADLHLQGYPLSRINTRNLEKQLEENRFILNAEVSKDISGRLEIRVEQRVALVRILPDGRRGFYMDMEGKVLPLSDQFTPLIMLASGNIPLPDADGEPQGKLEEIYRFCSFLAGQEFWSDQVVQIYIDRQGEYELIPRVGAHRILLGSMDQLEKKLRNLELLYQQGFSKYGWNTYETINLKYTNQVICTKR